jgi:phosphatidylglycerophosphate synthase
VTSTKIALLRLGPDEAPGARLRVAGLTALERSARQLLRHGYRVIVAATPGALDRLRLPAGAELRPVDQPAGFAPLAASLGDPLVVPADVVRPSNGRPDQVTAMRVTDARSRRAAEDAIFAELLRGDLGLVARHLNKPVSFRITRYLLCRLPITPNQVTIGAGLIGVAGAVLLALGHAWSVPGGLLLAHVQSILDGCDGELARVRLQQSAIGEWLDTIVDDALNLLLVCGLALGVHRLTGNPVYLWGGLAAAGMLLFYNVVAYRELVRQGEGGEVLKVRWWFARGIDLKQMVGAGGRKGFTGVLLTIGRRDFFVLAWLLLALAGLWPLLLLYPFLIAAANFTVAVGQLVVRRPA